MDSDLPKVSGVNIIHVSQDLEADEIQQFMSNWVDEHPDVTTDPGQIVIFSPYQMFYTLENIDGIDYLDLTGYMDRTKWATLSDADDLRGFAFQLEKNHADLKVSVKLALSVKEFDEIDEKYNFVTEYFAKNQDVHEMIVQMNMENEAEEAENQLDEDLDSELFGVK
jgi:hypothetical protein